jgi:outer membrane protein with beta-barrel domain
MSWRRLATLASMVAALSAAPQARAGAFLKGGAFFSAQDLVVDTSSPHWIAGFGSDSWLNDVFSLGFEVDFTYMHGEMLSTSEPVSTLYLYPYLTAKVRLPTSGFRLYAGGGIGYSPIITELDGKASQVGGLGLQVLGGVEFGSAATLFVEAQYKVTDVNDSKGRLFSPQTGSYDLFTIVGGIHF